MLQTILALIRKEFYQVFRDKYMVRMIFMMPIMQLLVLGYAVNVDVKNIYTAVFDFDRSRLSRDYVSSLEPGGYFIPEICDIPLTQLETGCKDNRFNAAFIIPEDFSEAVTRREKIDIGLILDGTNANSAAIAQGYAAMITSNFNREMLQLKEPVTLRSTILYNPEAESVNYMVPGIVAVLLMMITAMLTSMAIVREREAGTLEQLMVTPISVPALILGKTIPFALLGFLELSIALGFGVLWFDIPFVGSWGLLYLLSFIFLFTTLGMGMFISTMTKTQQQAMFFTWFFTIFAILTSGFFSPIANMPQSVQYLTYLNPLRYYMQIIRGIMMKGSGVDALYPEILAMIVFGLVIFGLAWNRFSKRVA